MVEEKMIQIEKYAFIGCIWIIQVLFTFATLCLKKNAGAR